MSVIQISAPAEEPVTVAELKTHCVVDFGDDDDYLAIVLKVAREVVERESGLLFIEQVWQEEFDCFPSSEIELAKTPVRSIESIKYIDADGVEQALSSANFQANLTGRPALLAPAYACRWPAVRRGYSAVKIQYKCGFSAASEVGFVSVPSMAKQAIMMQAKHLYENRERVSPVTLSEQPCAVSHLIGLIQVVGL